MITYLTIILVAIIGLSYMFRDHIISHIRTFLYNSWVYCWVVDRLIIHIFMTNKLIDNVRYIQIKHTKSYRLSREYTPTMHDIFMESRVYKTKSKTRLFYAPYPKSVYHMSARPNAKLYYNISQPLQTMETFYIDEYFKGKS
jgi:hypothetical protein